MTQKARTRVKELETQITRLRQTLNELYAERANLVDARAEKTYSLIDSTIYRPDPKQTYEQFMAAWDHTGITLPSYKSLQSKLEAAADRYQALQVEDPELSNHLSLVLVPPTTQLKKAIAHTGLNLIMNDGIDQAWKVTRTWQVMIVLGQQFDVRIHDLEAFLNSDFFISHEQDVRGMGIAELLAAEIQGCEITSPDEWTVLLHDTPAPETTICATRYNDVLIFDLDDTNCLLGDNYVTLTVKP